MNSQQVCSNKQRMLIKIRVSIESGFPSENVVTESQKRAWS